MDFTKTSNNKCNLLHILAHTITCKFPEYLNFTDDLTSIPVASKGDL